MNMNTTKLGKRLLQTTRGPLGAKIHINITSRIQETFIVTIKITSSTANVLI